MADMSTQNDAPAPPKLFLNNDLQPLSGDALGLTTLLAARVFLIIAEEMAFFYRPFALRELGVQLVAAAARVSTWSINFAFATLTRFRITTLSFMQIESQTRAVSRCVRCMQQQNCANATEATKWRA